AENEKTNWHPESIKHGRYGDWLANNVDWALSRDRYWGTPLPIWRCPEGHETCIGSRAELSALTGRDLSDLDPHRPFVDAVTFPCPTCGATRTATRRPFASASPPTSSARASTRPGGGSTRSWRSRPSSSDRAPTATC